MRGEARHERLWSNDLLGEPDIRCFHFARPERLGDGGGSGGSRFGLLPPDERRPNRATATPNIEDQVRMSFVLVAQTSAESAAPCRAGAEAKAT